MYITLAPGDLTETVNITATEPVNLDTTTSALGGIVGRQRVEVLPLNGRNVFQLAQLEIGVASAPGSRGANPDLTASGEISINGGRTLNTEAFVDGIPLANKGDNRISLRPNIVGNYLVNSGSKADRIKQYFNATAFAQPVPYSFGSASRTLPDLRSPGYLAANFSLQRDFKFTEHAKLQLRAEAFNLLNRANFQAPGTTLGGANFGVITTTEDPRQVQFAARLYF